MNKSILIIDTPKSCEGCELCTNGYICLRLGEVDESVENGTIDLRCPLKPIPMEELKQYLMNIKMANSQELKRLVENSKDIDHYKVGYCKGELELVKDLLEILEWKNANDKTNRNKS